MTLPSFQTAFSISSNPTKKSLIVRNDASFERPIIVNDIDLHCTTNMTQSLQNFWTFGDSSDSRDSFSASSDESSTYSLPPTPPATPPDSSQLWTGEDVIGGKKRSSSAVGRFACDFCSKVFGDRAHLQEHQRYRHSDERPYQCSLCTKTFKSRSNVKQHIRTSHERPRFDCTLCNRKSFTESGYRYHLLTAHRQPNNQRTFECSVCSKTFLQQKLLKRHFNSRHAEGTVLCHRCPFCPATFKRQDHATRHVTDIHSLVAKLFDCSQCGSKFQSATRLRQHERLHETRGTYHECHICRKRIIRKKNLRKHLELHKNAESVGIGHVLSPTMVDGSRFLSDIVAGNSPQHLPIVIHQ